MVIPLRDENRTWRFPIVTIALIGLNLFVFAFVQPHGSTALARFDYEHAAIPCELQRGHPLTSVQYETSSCSAPGLVGPATGSIFPGKNVYLAALTSMFLHGSWLHVLGNMLFLWVFGNNVEDRLGRVSFLAFYLVAGIVATIGYTLAEPGSTVPLVGASGAIAGVMGAYLVLWPRARILSVIPPLVFIPLMLPASFVLGVWFVLQFFTDPNSSVAWVAHVTGFGFGMLIGLGNRRLFGTPAPTSGSRRRPGPPSSPPQPPPAPTW